MYQVLYLLYFMLDFQNAIEICTLCFLIIIISEKTQKTLVLNYYTYLFTVYFFSRFLGKRSSKFNCYFLFINILHFLLIFYFMFHYVSGKIGKIHSPHSGWTTKKDLFSSSLCWDILLIRTLESTSSWRPATTTTPWTRGTRIPATPRTKGSPRTLRTSTPTTPGRDFKKKNALLRQNVKELYEDDFVLFSYIKIKMLMAQMILFLKSAFTRWAINQFRQIWVLKPCLGTNHYWMTPITRTRQVNTDSILNI